MNSLLTWVKHHKKLSVIIILAAWIVIGAAVSGGKQTASNAQAPVKTSDVQQTTVTPTAKPADVPKAVTIDYKTILDADNTVQNDSQHTMVLLIDPSHNNKDDLIALGKQLSQIAASKPSERFYADVYNDAQAAGLRDAVHAGTETTTQDNQYDPHYIGIYQKNPYSKLNRFTYQVGGVQDPNPVTINY
jgi:hypothetical protein